MLQSGDGLRALTGRRVAVVGAGPGGLASALLLARAGIHVTLFEKDAQVGGRTKTVEAPGGYRFDIGPTFFLYPQILADIFASCGERLEDHVKLERLDPQYHLVFEGQDGISGTIRATGDIARMEREIAQLAPDDAKNVTKFFTENRTKLRLLQAGPQQAFHTLRSMASPGDAGRPALPASRPERRPRPQAPLRRPAGAPRLLVPDQVPRHVAVPVPEPVHDPVVPRIRARGLPPGRRLRRRLRRHGGPRRPHGRRSPARTPTSSGCCSRASAPAASWPTARRSTADAVLINGDFAKVVPRPRAGAAPAALARRQDREGPALLLDLHALPRHRGENARRASGTTRSCWPRATSRTSGRSPRARCRCSPPCTCSMPATRMAAWRRPATPPSTCWYRCRT